MIAFDKWWAEKVQRQPKLCKSDTTIKMSIDQFRANMKQAFDAGWQQRNDEGPKPKSVFEEFNDLFKR